MRGITLFNYGGSGTIGLVNAGFEVPLILEIDKDMIENGAAQHFIYNYPDVKVLPPEDWENDSYLENLRNENLDIVIGWPPCSGLSMINRHASADNEINHHMYRWANAVKKIRPKTFIMENAPTLITKGKRILDDITELLQEDYRFSIIRDYAGNHNCCMRRLRTFVIGWRRDLFKSVPIINSEVEKVTVSEVLDKVSEDALNMEFVPERTCKDLEWVIPDMTEPISIVTHICKNYEKYEDKLDEKTKKRLANTLAKIREDKSYFDKSPNRLKADGLSPSLTSVTELIHYKQNRPLFIREYASIMGYPEDYVFLDNLKVPYLQSIAQGVPANFMKWAASKVREKLEDYIDVVPGEYDIVYEHLASGKTDLAYYTIDSFKNTEDITKGVNKE